MPERTVALSREVSRFFGVGPPIEEIRAHINEVEAPAELIVHGVAGVRALDMSGFLRSIADAYVRLRALDLLLHAEFEIGGRRFDAGRIDAPDPMNALRRISKELQNGVPMPLVVTGVSLHSPGMWEFLATLNPLEVIRKYLQDRHDRNKDIQYKNDAEARSLQIDIRMKEVALAKAEGDLQVGAVRQRFDLVSEAAALADRLRFDKRQRNQLLGYFVRTPLKKLASFQDDGIIITAEFVDGSPITYEKLRERRLRKAVHFLPLLAEAKNFETAEGVENLLAQVDLDSLNTSDKQLLQQLLTGVLARDQRAVIAPLLFFFTSLESYLRTTVPKAAGKRGLNFGSFLAELGEKEAVKSLSLGTLLRVSRKLFEIEQDTKWNDLIDLRNRLIHGDYPADRGLDAVNIMIKYLPKLRELEHRIVALTNEPFGDGASLA